ncbi:MAG: DUF1302 family protein [Deltaproteobacteria bacterium]|nr:DUF1302 family protein [Deltaproteobacteria bacterium]
MKSGLKFHAALFVLFTFIIFVFCHPAIAEQTGQDSEIEDFTEDSSDDLGSDFEDDSDADSGDALGDDFDDGESGEDLEVFEEEVAYEEPSPVAINGHFVIESSYNYAHKEPAQGATDWRGLSKLRSEFQLEVDAKLSESWQMFISGDYFYDFAYSINGRDNYTQEVLDDYEQWAQLRKAYIQGSLLKSLDIKFGRQIIVWGRSDNMRVTDVLNPLELREPGLTDIEDLRLPVAMTRLDYYYGDWNIMGVAVHEQRSNQNPAYGSDFYPLPLVYGPLSEEKPSSEIENTGFAVAVNGNFSGWDVSFYYADLYSHEAHVELSPTPVFPPVMVFLFSPKPVFHYADITMAGTAFNVTTGNWLFKAEAAYFTGIRFSDMTGSGNTGNYSRVDTLAGIEYLGFTDTTLNIDALNSHYTDFDDAADLMGAEENSFQTAVRISRDFFNETLNLMFLASVYGNGDDGALFRLTAEYDVTDNIEIIGGGVNYKSGDRPEFENIGDNDRVYLNVKYSF